MKAKILCATAVVIVSLLTFVPSINASDCGCNGYPSYGYTPYGFGYHAPYEPSTVIYSPQFYADEPCDNWMFGCGSGSCYGCGGVGGMFYGWSKWQYRPGLTRPYPNGKFTCCYNCGENCSEFPCCGLCQYSSCCEEHPADAAEPAVNDPAQKPTPAEPANDSSVEEETPASDSDPIPTDSDDIPVAHVMYKPAVGSNANFVPAPASRLSNTDVRDSRGAIFTVWAPIGAVVTVNGFETKSVGSQRSFVSYGLQPGQQYQYTFEAVIERNGQRYVETKTISVKAGAVETVAFAFPELNTKPSEDFEY